MTTQLSGISAYVGDIHGARLAHLEEALGTLGVKPRALLCTMDLDQVLCVQDLVDLEQRYRQAGQATVLVPGNHEAAIIHRIGIDSATYRKKRQDTHILALIEAIHMPGFRPLRRFLEEKLAIRGGVPVALGADPGFPGLLIHGALAGKEEKYIHEFPPELQTLVRERFDLWLRLETDEHLRANFAAMRQRGIDVMLRGHDHYVGLRSETGEGELCSHQVIINQVAGRSLEHGAERPRADDQPDDIVLVEPARLARAQASAGLYWHEIEAGRRYVVNFGPYYLGHFGLVRAAGSGETPAVAFCRTGVSFFTAKDRLRLKPLSLAHQARAGKTFYELFSGEA